MKEKGWFKMEKIDMDYKPRTWKFGLNFSGYANKPKRGSFNIWKW